VYATTQSRDQALDLEPVVGGRRDVARRENGRRAQRGHRSAPSVESYQTCLSRRYLFAQNLSNPRILRGLVKRLLFEQPSNGSLNVHHRKFID
jgi:hypothetical protein